MNIFGRKVRLKTASASQLVDATLVSTFIANVLAGKDTPLPSGIPASLQAELKALQAHLSTAKSDEDSRAWFNTGLAKFSDLLRNNNALSLPGLGDMILSNLVRYLNANQAALFIVDNSEDVSFLKLISCYAYERKKIREKRIELGEGMLGQCFFEKEPIRLKNTPKDYVKITSGLGAATPTEIYISPLLINDEVFGVIEIASFSEFTRVQMDFINKLSENIAGTIRNVQESERIRELLSRAQMSTEEIKAQEEELRQNMEELSATQEEMQRKALEIERGAAEMRSILNGVNATMATIEFDPSGKIITANENFLQTMKYSLAEIQGKHHRMFLTTEAANAPDYAAFWETLARGKSFSGTFKRVNRYGKTVWLNAIYNPVLNPNGEVIRVVKFAIDVSSQQEMLAEKDCIMDGINTTMATIEFTPAGIIEHANQNFLMTMKYRLQDIVGVHHRKFVPEEIARSLEYRNFWEALAAGRPMNGTFKRLNALGEIVTLNAIYTPIKNADGKVIRVIKFASEVKETLVEA